MVIDLKGYRIFIATPAGLDEARKAFRRVTEEYNESDAMRRGVMFLPIGWEVTLGGVGRPQALINKDLKECDFLILVLWDRWGSPTGDAEGTFTSGTEEEYAVAMECFTSPDFPMKEVVVFFKAVDERKLSDPGEQLKKVLIFREKLEREKTLLFHTYDELSIFESRLRSHLARWVRDHEDRSAKDEVPSDSSPPQIDQIRDEPEVVSIETSGPSGSNTLVESAKKLAFEGRLTEAETLFARAVANNNDLGALFSYALFLSQLGRLAQAKAKYEQVTEVADELGEPVWKARALNSLGNDYKSRGDLREAENAYNESLAIFRELHDDEGTADAYNNLGDLFQATQTRLNEAAGMYKESLKIRERHGSQERMADLYGSLGNVYKAQDDFDQAEEMHLKSLELKEKLGIQEGMAGAYSNLGNLYQVRNNLDEAEKMYRRSLDLIRQLKDNEGAADIYNNLGNVYQSRGELDQAEGMYKKSLDIYEELGDKASKADIFNSLGNLYVTEEEFEKAEETYRLSLEIFEQLRDKEGMADVYSNLADFYQARGDAEEAKIMNQKSEQLLRAVTNGK
jgi:tetratricopeptide (TPR) repeat protein